VSEEIFFEVGARIAALRGAMKQSEFAEKLGVNRNTITRWEAGERLPDGSSLLRMREAFGADINVILTGQAGGIAPSLRPDEEELLAHYRQANSDGRERIRQISATAANSPKREKKIDVPGISIGRISGGSGQIVSGNITNHGPITFGVSPPKPKKSGKP
jgi:transcriptional regulator with XRE-family HTH domain